MLDYSIEEIEQAILKAAEEEQKTKAGEQFFFRNIETILIVAGILVAIVIIGIVIAIAHFSSVKSELKRQRIIQESLDRTEKQKMILENRLNLENERIKQVSRQDSIIISSKRKTPKP